jgi:membrane-associated phospholipid phosphatase
MHDGGHRTARDLGAQLALWACFGLAYEAVRGARGDDRAAAFANGRSIIAAERHLHSLFEASLQHAVGRLAALSDAARVTYWLSEFVILVAALAWVYFRDRRLYSRFRNAVLAANGAGLLGYVLLPTAPPRLFPSVGFTNRLSGQSNPEHPGGLIGFAANPYAAMPSIHAADAVLIGVFLAAASASLLARVVWLAWPLWVFFAVLATGNHFWLDVVAGVAAASIALGFAELVARATARAPIPLLPRPAPRASPPRQRGRPAPGRAERRPARAPDRAHRA